MAPSTSEPNASGQQVGLGLGANLGDPEATLKEALRRIQSLPATEIEVVSPTYWTPPWGVNEPQPDYLNAVCLLATQLTPDDLLVALQVIEHALGRVRGPERYAARALDLDILFFGDQIIDEANLQVPHPRLSQRGFVLLPLADIAPNLEIAGLDRVDYLLEALDEDALDGIRPAQIDLAI